ncbi:MAG: lytic transglycosylase domain-containing protein [Reyranellaceae bacterium]
MGIIPSRDEMQRAALALAFAALALSSSHAAAQGARNQATVDRLEPEPAVTRSVERRQFPFGEILPPGDSGRYQAIFDAQERGDFKRADAEIAALADRMLLGHVLAQRYLHNAYKSRYEELAEWLAIYSDHPDAPRVYALALKKRPAGAAEPTPSSFIRPSTASSGRVAANQTPPTKMLSITERSRANALKKKVEDLARRESFTQALRLLESKEAQNWYTPGEIDRMRASIASRLFLSGKDDELALGTAREAASDEAVMANWTAGLAAWRLGAYSEAARRFQALAAAPNVAPWNAAAGAFWAARANLLAGNPEHYNPWMRKAAAHPRTFYGILALRTIGGDPGFLWTPQTLTRPQFDLIANDRAGRRALALLSAGEVVRAEQELHGLTLDADPGTIAAVLALAEEARLPDLALRVANSVQDEKLRDSIRGLDAALYPVPNWQPKGGFVVDPSLVYAFVRQESAFNPRARSRAGAAGLMQLMPATARAMARRAGSPADANRVYQPDVNLMLGQEYLRHLMEYAPIGANLFLVAAAYNSGPGNLQRWQSEVNYNDDPLLFIASIPVRETRLFIERVMANLWIYQMRLNQGTPTLDALASHRWPLYVSVDSSVPGNFAQASEAERQGGSR